MISALKHFVYDFKVAENKALNRELESELDKIISFWMECRPFTAGLEFPMNYIKMSVAQMNTKLSAIKQKQRINEKLDSLITDKIISADETIVQKAMTQFSDTDEEVILILGGVHLL